MRVGGISLNDSLPDLRGQIAALVSGTIPLDRFLDWYFANSGTIEFEGSDEDVDLLNGVFLRYAEYTSDYIDATQLIDALREDVLESIREAEEYWREYLGECLDATDVRQLLGIESPETLDDLVTAHQILAVPSADGMAFPAFQFVGGRIDPTVSRVVDIFSGVVATPYTTASWLRGVRFEDQSITEWIERGKDPEVIIRGAEDSAVRLAT